MSSVGSLIGWVPAAFYDEVCPAPRDTPDSWLRVGDHAYLDGSDDDLDPVPVSEGERVTFYSLTNFPGVRLRWTGNPGDVTIDGTIAAESTSLAIAGDLDSVAESVDALAAHMRRYDYEPGTYEVQVYRWCDGVVFLHRGGVLTRVGPA